MLPSPRWLRTASLALAVAAALPAQDDLAERLFHSGERAYAARSHGEALETWRQLLQQAPASPFAARALLAMARHHLDVEHKADAAMPLLERLKAEHMKTPQAAEALLLRGTVLAERSRKPQDLKEAMGELNRLVDLFPEHPAVQEARYRLGLACLVQGQPSRALAHFVEALRLDPGSPVAPKAQLQLAEALDLTGDLPGCLRLLQGLRNRWPASPEAEEAAWRLAVRVKHRLQKPPLRSEGPWPQGRQKWLKTPTLMAVAPNGALLIYQDDLDRAFELKGAELMPAGPVAKNAKALLVGPSGQPWLLVPKLGVVKEEGQPPLPLPTLASPTGAFLDAWGALWVADAKAGSLTVVAADGSSRQIPTPAPSVMAALPGGGGVVASDANRSLLFLDAEGQPRLTVPYGKDLPAAFREVLALASDPTGHVAALVEGGDFEGVVLWGPDGTLLRQATFKALGISGRFRALALDRQGGILLADRSNDLLIRLN